MCKGIGCGRRVSEFKCLTLTILIKTYSGAGFPFPRHFSSMLSSSLKAILLSICSTISGGTVTKIKDFRNKSCRTFREDNVDC